MRRYLLPAILVVGLVGFSAWWFSPTQTLKRKTGSLLTTLTMDAGSGKVGRQSGAYSLNALLAKQIELTTPTINEANGMFQREELESAYSWLANQAKMTRFELEEFESVEITGDKATVKFTLEGLVELPTYRPADGTYRVVFDWEKEKDGWRLYKAVWDKAP